MSTFWDFPPCSKINVLDTRRPFHREAILAALMDPTTSVQIDHQHQERCTIFNQYSALLAITHLFSLRHSLAILQEFLSLG